MFFLFVVAPFCSCPASLVSRKFFAVGPGCAKCFFFVALRWAPRPFGGARAKKKNTLGGVFFLRGPAGTLTHSLRAWVAMPPPRRGGVFFLLRPRPDRGGVFFFCCGPARTLTHSLWAGAISARPRWCFFFLLRPRRVFLDNSKKCLGYYIGSKKTRRGHSKKKNTTSFRRRPIYTHQNGNIKPTSDVKGLRVSAGSGCVGIQPQGSSFKGSYKGSIRVP